MLRETPRMAAEVVSGRAGMGLEHTGCVFPRRVLPSSAVHTAGHFLSGGSSFVFDIFSFNWKL